MSANLKPGDQVCLKSGGPTMTVNKVYEDAINGPLVECVWFIDEDTRRDTFSQGALDREDED